jgi:AcrR family transcriptional regulator
MSDPAEDIMHATYCALCECGYADLTMQDIADRADRSKPAIHYHYESKQSLLRSFLDYLYKRFVDRVGGPGGDGDPDERLRTFVDAVLHPPHDEDTTQEFRTALLEIKAQAPYDDALRDRLARFDAHISDTVETLAAEAIEAGIYTERADPAEIACFVVTLVDGAQSRHVVAADQPATLEDTLGSYLDTFRRSEAEAPS